MSEYIKIQIDDIKQLLVSEANRRQKDADEVKTVEMLCNSPHCDIGQALAQVIRGADKFYANDTMRMFAASLFDMIASDHEIQDGRLTTVCKVHYNSEVISKPLIDAI